MNAERGGRGMQSPFIKFLKMPRPMGGVIHLFSRFIGVSAAALLYDHRSSLSNLLFK
jgi:hypothetical protein